MKRVELLKLIRDKQGCSLVESDNILKRLTAPEVYTCTKIQDQEHGFYNATLEFVTGEIEKVMAKSSYWD